MLNISIVLYKPDAEQLNRLLRELVRVRCLNRIYLIDNSGDDFSDRIPLLRENGLAEYRLMPSNLGYGKGHNTAIRQSIADAVPFHLVMNADVEVKAEVIDSLHTFMEQNGVVGSLMPRVVYPDGSLQYLCKLLPAPLDVFGRRFLPTRWMRSRNERYELRQSGYDRPLNVPYLSGCFMFLRTRAVEQAGLFDERFFMYPEDIDLTRRIHRDWITLYYPAVTIVHNHERASYRSLRMTGIHLVNMCRYFNKWGWISDKERKLVNQLTLEQLKNIHTE